jgi:hypothetical protein
VGASCRASSTGGSGVRPRHMDALPSIKIPHAQRVVPSTAVQCPSVATERQGKNCESVTSQLLHAFPFCRCPAPYDAVFATAEERRVVPTQR